jgi:hypothetical protein
VSAIWRFPKRSPYTRVESERLPGVWLIARVDGNPPGHAPRKVEEDPGED